MTSPAHVTRIGVSGGQAFARSGAASVRDARCLSTVIHPCRFADDGFVGVPPAMHRRRSHQMRYAVMDDSYSTVTIDRSRTPRPKKEAVDGCDV